MIFPDWRPLCGFTSHQTLKIGDLKNRSEFTLVPGSTEWCKERGIEYEICEIRQPNHIQNRCCLTARHAQIKGIGGSLTLILAPHAEG